MILRCTKKLLAVLGASHAAEPGPTPDAGDWYASPLWSGRRKCLLLTHAATLFSVFEAGVRAADLRATHRLVTGLVERELRHEGLPPATFGNLRSQEDRHVLVDRLTDQGSTAPRGNTPHSHQTVTDTARSG